MFRSSAKSSSSSRPPQQPSSSLRPSQRPTPPPFRFILQSKDKLCHLSMQLAWIDEAGHEQSWNSWKDSLCGYYEAMKLLPASSRQIRASFKTMPGGHKVRKVDRHNRCAWCDGEEVIEMSGLGGSSEGLDVIFELRGPILHCYICRAWNRRNAGSPEPWEYWPGFPPRKSAVDAPGTLQAADLMACWTGSAASDADDEDSQVVRVANAMKRLHAAAEVMLHVRQQTKAALEKLDKQLKKQWYKVNSTNTVAAGLGVASFVTLFTIPPVGVALGVGSAAVGLGATGSDMAGDHFRGNTFAKAVQQDLYEQLGFTSVEAEMQITLESALCAVRKPRGGHGTRRAVAAAGQAASVLSVAFRTLPNVIRAGRVVNLTRAGQGVAAAGKVLGGAGAVLAVGVAVVGWSTMKPNQKMVREKLDEVNCSISHLTALVQNVSDAMTCPICNERLDYGDDAISRCDRFHCFHAECLRSRADLACPLCPQIVRRKTLHTISSSIESLRAMLWLSGVKDCAMNLEALGPQLVARGRDVITDLSNRLQELGADKFIEIALDTEEEPAEARTNPFCEPYLPEDAETHEAWQDALEEVEDLTSLEMPQLNNLLSHGKGMPLKYRHRLWPRWLHVPERMLEADTQKGISFSSLLETSLPEDIRSQVELDIPRTRREFAPADQHPQLRNILSAWCSYNDEVGYAQGMNEVAAVFLKCGFEEEVSFWMMAEVIEIFVPGCHAQGLAGLLRDIAVADVLVQTFLPGHAATISEAGVQPVCLYADFFLTLGSKNNSLQLIARLWDLTFLHGPKALFSGLLASLDLFFPVSEDGEVADDEALVHAYRSASKLGDPEVFACRLLYFLNEYQGGISDDLVADLRASLGQPKVCLETIPDHVIDNARQLMCWFCERARQTMEDDDCSCQQTLIQLTHCPIAIDNVSDQPVLSRRTSSGMLAEDATSHEVWKAAIESAGSIEAMEVQRLEELLSHGAGMPLKYRIMCWPIWLRQHQHTISKEKTGIANLDSLPAEVLQQITADVEGLSEEFLPASQHEALRNFLAAAVLRKAGNGYIDGLCHVGNVFLKLGFDEKVALDIFLAALDWIVPGSHSADLHGLFRDIAVADILTHTFLPLHATAMSVSGIPIIWLAADYFLALGCKGTRLPFAVRLLDLCFLHGPRALFCGWLALLQLYFPLPSGSPKNARGVTHVLATFFERCHHSDTDAFTKELRRFLHEHHGGITSDLIEGLRQAVLDKAWNSPSSKDHGPHDFNLESDRLAMDEQTVNELGLRSRSLCFASEAEVGVGESVEKREADNLAADKEQQRLVDDVVAKLEDQNFADRLEVEGLTQEDVDRLEEERTVEDETDRMDVERHQEAVLAQAKAKAEAEALAIAKNVEQEEAERLTAEKARLVAAEVEAEFFALELIAKENVGSIEQGRLEAEVLAKADAEGLAGGETVVKEEAEGSRESKEQEGSIAEMKVKGEGETITNAGIVVKAEVDPPALTLSAREVVQRTEQEAAPEHVAKEEAERLATEEIANKEEVNRIEREVSTIQDADDSIGDEAETIPLARVETTKWQTEEVLKIEDAAYAIKNEAQRFDPPRRETRKSENMAAHMSKPKAVEAAVDESTAKEEADILAAEKEKERLAVEVVAKDEDQNLPERLALEQLEAEEPTQADADQLEKEKNAKDETDKMAADKHQETLPAQAKAKAEAKAVAMAESAAKEEAERLAAEKEQERIVAAMAAKAEKEKAESIEQERLEAEVLAKAEADRLGVEKVVKEEAERIGEGREQERSIAEVEALAEVEAVAKVVVVAQDETDRPALTLVGKEDVQRTERKEIAGEEAPDADESVAENAAKEGAERLATEEFAKKEEANKKE